jgi:hypothetical protein
MGKTLLLLCILSPGCISEKNRNLCDYRVQLRYDYNEENSNRDNRIGFHVTRLDEMIFDSEGVLASKRRFENGEYANPRASELVLDAGRYSVIAIGNMDDRSVLLDEATGEEPAIGVTRRETPRLSLENADPFGDGTRGPCEQLFHGYRTFTVREAAGISRVRVDMVNAHFELSFRVTWKNTSRAPAAGVYYAVLQDIPSQYKLMPEWVFPAGSFDAVRHDPALHDSYDHTANDVIHHIPHTTHEGNNVLSHSNTAYLNGDGEVWGRFVNYRIKTDTEPVMTLYYAADGARSRATDPMVLPREIKLKDYFAWVGQQLDHELKQEYTLDIVVDGDQIIISPFDEFSIADWNEGGSLN